MSGENVASGGQDTSAAPDAVPTVKKSCSLMAGLGRWKPEIGAGIAGVITIFLAVSSDHVKSLVSGWLDTCIVVIERGDSRKQTNAAMKRDGTILPVSLHVVGASEVRTAVYFQSPKCEIASVTFVRDPTQGGRAFHRHSNLSCPDAGGGPGYCSKTVPEGKTDTVPECKGNYKTVGWAFDGFDGVLDYRFDVLMDAVDDGAEKRVLVYAVLQDEKLAAKKVCRFEDAAWFNVLATYSTTWKAILAALAVAVLAAFSTLIARWVK